MQYVKRRKKMAEKQPVKVLNIDIRSFDPVYGTVTFEFTLERYFWLGSGAEMHYPVINGNAIIAVSPERCTQETEEEILNHTNFIWYYPDNPEEKQYYQDSDDEFKVKMRKIAYNTIWAVRKNGKYQ